MKKTKLLVIALITIAACLLFSAKVNAVIYVNPKPIPPELMGGFAYSKKKDGSTTVDDDKLRSYYDTSVAPKAQLYYYYIKDNGKEVVLYACNSVGTVDKTTGQSIPAVRGEVVIPNTIENIPVTEIAYGAFSSCKGITKITIPNTVKVIEEQAFYGCEALKEVVIPSSVEKIGTKAFNKCTNLQKITLSEGLKEIGEYAFWECKNLADIKIPSTVTKIGQQAFRETAIKEITIPEGITFIEPAMFKYCKALEKVNLPESVTGIGSFAFDECTSLKTIKLPSKLKEIHEEAFRGSGIEEIVLPNTLTYVEEYAFRRCSNLKEVTIPSSMKVLPVGTFSGCSSLKKADLPANLTEITVDMFTGCNSLETITLPETVTSIGAYSFLSCTSIKEIKIPEKVTEIGYRAFYVDTVEGDKSSLEKVYFGKSIKTIEEEAFKGCDKVTFYGYKDTVPEKFAKENNIPFVYLDGTNNTAPVVETKTLKENTNKVEVTAKTEKDSKLTINKIEAKNYKDIVKGLKNYKVIASYDVSVSGKYEGDITVTFQVGKQYNGKTATILHKKADGTIEKFQEKIKNGKVSVTVKELSPFVVTINSGKDNTPATGVIDIVPVVLSLTILSIVGLAYVAKKN